MECNTKNGVFCLWDHLRVQICTTLENEMRSQLKLLHGKTIRKKKNVVTVIFTFEKWFDEIQNIFIMYIDFSHRFYHANISYTTFSLCPSLSLSLFQSLFIFYWLVCRLAVHMKTFIYFPYSRWWSLKNKNLWQENVLQTITAYIAYLIIWWYIHFCTVSFCFFFQIQSPCLVIKSYQAVIH